VAAERQEDRVGDIADAGLNGQEALGQAPGDELVRQEFGYVFADFFGGGIAGSEGARFILEVRFDDADDFFGRDGDDGRADAVAGRVDRDLAAVGRIGGLVDVVNAEKRGGNCCGSAR
jgi:hypothetical protein